MYVLLGATVPAPGGIKVSMLSILVLWCILSSSLVECAPNHNPQQPRALGAPDEGKCPDGGYEVIVSPVEVIGFFPV
jgi:hypothetical protein